MEAKRHMLDGIACLQNGAWEAALRHFDRAVELREVTPWRENSESAWLLAAACINRSDALRALGRIDEGIESLDRAIDAMGYVPVDENAAYADRLILAWTNRGTTCGEAGRAVESLDGFAKAEDVLQAAGGIDTPARKLLAAMLHTNRARVLLDLGRVRGGWSDARLAVDFMRQLEPNPTVAEASIKTRGILCRAMVVLLDERGGIDVEGDWIATATDLAEEALTIVRGTGYRSPWVGDLVRYGARIYRKCQPHFLGEFLCEWLAPDGPLADDAGLKREMVAEIAVAKIELERRVVPRLHETEFVKAATDTLASLQFAESTLAESSQRNFACLY